MSFNSFIFLLAFLPMTLIVYYLLRAKGCFRGSLYFLCLMSLGFYAYNCPSGIITLLLSLALNYLLAIAILRKKRAKLVLVTGVIFDTLCLCVFKYGPALMSGEFILNAPGVSFYTFLEIALLAECYRGTIKKLTIGEYSFLMTFFPKMMQGPIVDPVDFLNQETGNKYISWEEIYRGILLFSLGLFKKVIIADTLGEAVNYGFSNPNSIHTMEGLVVILSYTLQLYFDFSGYTDMAIAIAGFFGFKLPGNFDSPYKAASIEDFWKRWHITLTRFFTKYIYIPLGGNRRGNARTLLNLALIFIISGMWHGAGWQFIIWGAMHGALYVLHRAVKMYGKGGSKEIPEQRQTGFGRVKTRFVHFLKVFATFVYVNIAWVFFRAPSVGEALRLFKSVGELWFPRFNIGLAQCFNIDEMWYVIKLLHFDRFSFGIYILMIVILVLLLVLVFKAPSASEYARNCKISVFTTAMMLVILCWCILSFEGVATYLYVNF